MRASSVRGPLLWLAVLAAAAAPVAAQPASYTTFGTSCHQNLALTVQGVPRLGQGFVVIYNGHSGNGFIGPVSFRQQPILFTGLSNTSAGGGIRLPWQIPPAINNNIAGCFLYTSLEVVMPMPFDRVQGNYVRVVGFSIPNVPALIGATFFQQWALWVRRFDMRSGVTTEWVLTTNAGQGVIGT